MKFRFPAFIWLLVAFAAFRPSECLAEIHLPSIFTDNMVLQRDRPNPLWGWEEPGEKITVTIAGSSISTTTAADGRWRTTLPALPARREPINIRVSSSTGSVRTIKNVLVGEVWVFVGPSNIYWPVSRCDSAQQEMASADFPEIRFFTVKRATADKAQDDCAGDWFECSPKTVGPVSGIAYFFSRRIHRDLNVPIGVLQSYWGGTRVEAWTSLTGLQKQPELKPILEWWKEAQAGQFDAKAAQEDYTQKLEVWKKQAAAAKRNGKPAPAKPKKLTDPTKSQHRPACLFNAMVAPLIPYGIQGIVTYQGLGNLYWAEHSRPLMSAMIRDWRDQWGQGNFPIGLVQPTPYPCDNWAHQRKDAYSLQRESQLLALDEFPNLGIAPTMDIGSLTELHFTNKQDVGRRMAHWALSQVYQRPAAYSAPRYKSMSVEGDRIRVRFRDVAGGLSTNDGKPPTHFTIAGEDGRFAPATATIDEDSVLVHSPTISKPVAVRFAWSDTAIPNLVNDAGMPVSIFRTDAPATR